MNTEFESSFIVMPSHCNHMQPMIFGGHFFAEIDLCAAHTVRRFLYDSVCDSAVTYRVNNGEFKKAAQMGDFIVLQGKIISTRVHAIIVRVNAHRENKIGPGNIEKDHMAEFELVFVSRLGDKVHPHGLKV